DAGSHSPRGVSRQPTGGLNTHCEHGSAQTTVVATQGPAPSQTCLVQMGESKAHGVPAGAGCIGVHDPPEQVPSRQTSRHGALFGTSWKPPLASHRSSVQSLTSLSHAPPAPCGVQYAEQQASPPGPASQISGLSTTASPQQNARGGPSRIPLIGLLLGGGHVSQ